MRRITAWLFLVLGCLALAGPALAADAAVPHATSPVQASNGLPAYPPVLPGQPLRFPHDFGAHPAYRTEWWYATGWLYTPDHKPLGFQITFFRSRPDLDARNPSRFAPAQLLFAHAALADPSLGHLQHDQRAARAGFGLAEAAEGDTRVHIDDWILNRGDDGTYQSRIQARDFTLDLSLRPTGPVLPQGDSGYSRKGPRPEQSSEYYSQPGLAVTGFVTRDGLRTAVSGTAWLDHEWSSELLAQDAVGWDWTGLNLENGAALMAFRIRDATGRALWAGGSWRQADGRIQRFGPHDVAFQPTRWWQSPRTQTRYPIAPRLRAGPFELDLEPLMDDQELDTRASTGAVYWEGAVSARRDGRAVGQGYLELTGYFQPLDF